MTSEIRDTRLTATRPHRRPSPRTVDSRAPGRTDRTGAKIPRIVAARFVVFALFASAAMVHAEAPGGRADALADSGDAGPYVGLGLGAAGFHFDSIGLPERSSNDTGHFAGKTYLGYRFDRHWGIEAGYAALGRVQEDYSTGTFKGRAESAFVAGVGRLPLGTDFSLVGRVIASADRLANSGSTAGVPQFAQLSGRRGNISLGIGAEYRLEHALSATLDIDGFGKFADKVNGGLVSVGLQYRF